MTRHLIPWYDYLRSHGILVALGDPFSNYTPPYTYLLALATLTASFLSKVTAIKLLSVAMDFVNAFLVYKIVRLKYPSGPGPFWAAGAFLCLPTVFVNSAVWGQADAFYAGFLLASLYYTLREMPLPAMLAFAVAFGFKAQAVFFLPFLAVLLFKGRTRFPFFLLIPVVYLVLCLPVILLGRDWLEVLLIYLRQGETYRQLSAHAPNLYIFIPNRFYRPGLWAGLAATLIGLVAWLVLSVRDKRPLTSERLVLLALVSVALAPFLLPKMHDRYFYPADLLSLVAAFFLPELRCVPLAYQIISGLAYTVFLSRASVGNVYAAAVLNTLLVAGLLWKQLHKPAARGGDSPSSTSSTCTLRRTGGQ